MKPPLIRLLRRFGKYGSKQAMERLLAHSFIDDFVKHDAHVVLPTAKKMDIVNKQCVWVYWASGFSSAPLVVRACAERLAIVEKDRQVIFLDDNTLQEFIDLPHSFQKAKEISVTHFSDILRVSLLRVYGGTWVDATVFINDQTKNFLPKLDYNFFVFARCDTVIISSWFMSAGKDSYRVCRLYEALYVWWLLNDFLPQYYWLHYLYEALVDCDEKFARLHGRMKKLSGLPLLKFSLVSNRRCSSQKSKWLLSFLPLHKLSHKSKFIGDHLRELGSKRVKLFSFTNLLSQLWCQIDYIVHYVLRPFRVLQSASKYVQVFHGGLGNQLFQYAFIRHAKSKSILFDVDLSFYHSSLSEGREFKITPLVAEFGFAANVSFYRVRLSRALARVHSDLGRALGLRLVEETRNQIDFYKDVNSLPNGLYYGYWQNFNYAREAMPQIVDWISGVSLPVSLENWYQFARSNHVMSIHVRRGDYLKPKSGHIPLPLSYYKKSIASIMSDLPSESTVFLFTDDICWVKTFVMSLVPFNCILISEINTEGDEASELKLMSACRVNIISNSTFSWWGAAISGALNPNHLTVSPKGYMDPAFFEGGNGKLVQI
ncbi:alpha-1,2-fucosyltransferase [Alphaproteobacteria bacterium]|nr:alpha-1,2-fucosyltransferase [Alphaproteobacteria bacterium]